jgi:group I intron endonuclease
MKIKGIYKIQSIIKPDRIYIGSSKDITSRWKCHLYELKRGTHHSPKLQKHYNKYGSDDLIFSILHECDDIIDCEQSYLDKQLPYFNICLPNIEKYFNMNGSFIENFSVF